MIEGSKMSVFIMYSQAHASVAKAILHITKIKKWHYGEMKFNMMAMAISLKA